MGQPVSLADVIAKRHDVLQMLVDDPRGKPGLVEDLDTSRSTIDRAIASLEDDGLVTRVDGRYRATFTGRCVLSAFREYHQRLADIERSQAVLDALPPEVGLDPVALEGATVEESPSSAYDYCFERTMALVREADRLRAVGAGIPPRYLDAIDEQVRRNDLAVEYVVTPDVLTVFERVEPDVAGEFSRRERVTLYRLPEALEYALWIVESAEAHHSGIVALSGSGVVGVIRNDSAPMNEWAREAFRRYREGATGMESLSPP